MRADARGEGARPPVPLHRRVLPDEDIGGGTATRPSRALREGSERAAGRGDGLLTLAARVTSVRARLLHPTRAVSGRCR